MVNARLALRITSVVVACVLAGPPAAVAIEYSGPQKSCFGSIAHSTLALVKSRMKAVIRCNDAKLVSPGACFAPDPAVLQRIDDGLIGTITGGCGSLAPADIAAMGFPGPCPDPDVSDGYTSVDLETCMGDLHRTAVDAILSHVYPPGSPAIGATSCVTRVASAVAKLTVARMKALQKCRKQIVNAELNIWPERCDTDDERTRRTIAKAEERLTNDVVKRCTAEQLVGVCLNPAITDLPDVIKCLIDEIGFHINTVDDIGPAEFHCGNGFIDTPDEECDGGADAACPGRCGAHTDPVLGCRCTDRRLQWVVEHAGADLDLGWTPTHHDRPTVGGGYVTDAFDCDGPGGPDTECAVGPSCSLPPHQPCSPAADELVSADSLCPGPGNSCRKTRAGATGPHCDLDIQQRCESDAQCPLPGDSCVKPLHGPPVPVSQGGVGVCIVNTFSEDVVGTTDVATGMGSVALRQRSNIHLGFMAERPCPVCGDFCAFTGEQCQSADDCSEGPCITSPVCSDGPNRGRRCRRVPPFGSENRELGATSVDCPADPTTIVGGPPLEMRIDDLATRTATLVPTHACSAPEFASNACIGGSETGRPCADPSECPGGTCGPQCFCPDETHPNACAPACAGGANDAAPCGADSECPAGFCHHGDCRALGTDDDSNQEGHCTVSESITGGTCSIESFRACSADADCQPPTCASCMPGQTCEFADGNVDRQCFVNAGIVRDGFPGTPERTTAATFCLPLADVSYGHAGPGALQQRERAVVTGF